MGTLTTRRSLLKTACAFAATSGTGVLSGAVLRNVVSPSLSVNRLTIDVGARMPFRAVHISDTHLVYCDARDGERKRNLAAFRMKEMRRSERYLCASLHLAANERAMVLHTGDFIDFTSEANFDALAEHVKGVDVFACAGNHEFSQFVGEAREDEAYKAQSYAAVQSCWPNDLTFASRVVNGVNFIAADNVYYNFTEKQLALLEAEIAKGLPIVFLCHVPLYTPELFKRQMARQGADGAALCGVSENLLSAYSPSRAQQQRADAPTAAFVARLKSEKLVKAVLAGHIHKTCAVDFSPTARLYTVGATYEGKAQVIEFV